MEYPIFEVPYLGGSLLIATIAIVHVFISHFSVGAACLIAVAERRAIRTGDESMRQQLRKYAWIILLGPYVLGTVTGVGIWFTIALVSPRAVSLLIHQFVWDWAIEWVFFIIEGVAISIYVFYWDRMAPKAHNRIGWIFAICSIATLLVINAIVSFMLTPGDWQPFAAGALNYKAIFNPTYIPSALGRILICLALAGAGAVALLAFDTKMPDEIKRKLASLAYKFMLPAALCIPLGIWTFSKMSDRAQTFLMGGAAPLQLFLGFGMAALMTLLVATIVAMIRKNSIPSPMGATLLCLLAFISFGAMEFVREGSRKPYVIEGFMYSTGVTPQTAQAVDSKANITQTRINGILSVSGWPLIEWNGQGKPAPLQRGRAVYRSACLRCHSVDGYNAVRPLVKGWSDGTINHLLDNMDEIRPAMPPFPGTQLDKHDLVIYLKSLNTVAN